MVISYSSLLDHIMGIWLGNNKKCFQEKDCRQKSLEAINSINAKKGLIMLNILQEFFKNILNGRINLH